MFRNNTTSLFGAVPFAGTVSTGNERNTTRPRLSTPVFGNRIPQTLPEADS